MTTHAYVAPELTELGILNVDTLSKSGGGKKKKRPVLRTLSISSEGGDRDQNDPYCEKRIDFDECYIYSDDAN